MDYPPANPCRRATFSRPEGLDSDRFAPRPPLHRSRRRTRATLVPDAPGTGLPPTSLWRQCAPTAALAAPAAPWRQAFAFDCLTRQSFRSTIQYLPTSHATTFLASLPKHTPTGHERLARPPVSVQVPPLPICASASATDRSDLDLEVRTRGLPFPLPHRSAPSRCAPPPARRPPKY